LEVSEQERTDDLERTKLATMNLLEDLDAEKVQLEQERKKDEALLVSIGDGVVVTDEAGRITFVNKAFKEILGWDEVEVMGKVMVEILAKYDENGEEIPHSERSISKVLSGELEKGSKSTVSRSHYYIKKDRSKIPIIGTVTPIVIGEKITGAVQVFHDITKEKEIDQIKDDFLSLASHELRTPLTAIDGLVSMIRDKEYGEVNPNLMSPLEDINISTERLIRLVNDLLNLSRIQAGRLRYNLTEFSISEVIDKAISLLGSMFEEKGLTIAVGNRVDAIVFADMDKVIQIINNLAGNSFKFTDSGGVTINVEDDSDLVKVSVVDTGIGIKKEDQAKLFGKFQQLDSVGSKPQGTGLGLHISREIVRKMGGDLVLAASVVGHGSTFSFSLPKAGTQSAQRVKEEIESEALVHPDQK
jgi:PAS domain S-box-containing protein